MSTAASNVTFRATVPHYPALTIYCSVPTPTMAGTPSTIPGCSKLCPAWPWMLPGIQEQPQLLWDKWNILKKLSAHPLRSSALSSCACPRQAVVNKSDPMKSSIPAAAASTQGGISDSERVHCEKTQTGLPFITIPGAVHRCDLFTGVLG